MSNQSVNELSFDGKQQLIDEQHNQMNGKQQLKSTSNATHQKIIDTTLASDVDKGLVNNYQYINKTITSSEVFVPNGDQSIGDHLDDRMSVTDEDTDNQMTCDNRSNNKSIGLTNGDINDNNDVNEESLMDQTDCQSDSEVGNEMLAAEEGYVDEKSRKSVSEVNEISINGSIKSDFTETNETMTVYLYVKDVTTIDINYSEDVIELKLRTKDSELLNNTYVWSTKLHGQIIPNECKHKLKNSTIELYLTKKVSQKWSSIEPKTRTFDSHFAKMPTNSPTENTVTLFGPQLDNESDEDIWQSPTQTPPEMECTTSGHFGAVDPSTSSVGKELVLVPDNNNSIESALRPNRQIKPKLIGWTGLHNLGNTCFMNAVLQCLSNTDPFRDYFISGEFAADINKTNTFGSGGVIANTFADVLSQLWAGTDSSIAPSKLKERMGEKWATFSSYLQQDAQEFCAYFLDALHEDLNRCRERSIIKNDKNEDSNEAIDDQRLADDSWKRFGLLNDSIVTQLFYGQYKSKLVCPVCGKISVTFDPFVYLSLPLPKPKLEYEVFFFKRDSNGMSTSKPIKYNIKLTKDSIVQNLLDEVSKATDVNTSALRCVQSFNNGTVEKFLQPKWTLDDPDIRKYLLVFELMSPNKELNEEVSEFVVIQRLCQPLKSDNCAKCDKNQSWDNVDLKSCTKCHRVAYCDKTCQSDHWPTHKKDCVYKPEPMAVPFVISVAKSQLTYRYLCEVVFSYARHSLRFSQPMNLNEFPIPPPFKLKVYRDLSKEEKEELIEPNPECGDNRFDTPLDINNYYIALDWINAKGFGDNWVEVESQIGIDCQTDYNYPRNSSSNDSIDLEDCLRLHTKPEVLTPENPWYCPQCKESREATKQITLWRLPNILVIQLKRFKFRNIIWREKIDSMVKYPIHGLDMSQYYVRTDSNPDFHPIYDLFGVINHFGGLFGGHYTAYAKTSHDSKNIGWRCFDDSRVDSKTEGQIVTTNAYMLFYKLRENN